MTTIIGIEPGFVTDANGRRICDYRPWPHSGDDSDDYGRLLAAAPGLLDTLRRVLADAEDEHAECSQRREADGWGADAEPTSFAAARALIAQLELPPNNQVERPR